MIVIIIINNNNNAIIIGGIGLPDRDYYFDEDKQEKRSKYIEYIAFILHQLGQHDTDKYSRYKDIMICQEIAQTIFEFEKSIASTHLTRAIARDPLVTYNKMSIMKLFQSSLPMITWSSYLTVGSNIQQPFVNWIQYFEFIGKSEVMMGDINVTSLNAIKSIPTLVNKYASTLSDYLLYHSINSFADHLPNVFSDAKFNFFEKELKGTLQQLPRWKRALQSLEYALGR